MPTMEEIQAEMLRREMQKRGLQSNQEPSTPTQFPVKDGKQPYEYVGGEITGGKKEPGFMQNLALVDSSLAQGTLDLTGRIASAFEQVLRLGGQPKTVPRAIEYWNDKTKKLQEKYAYGPIAKGAAQAARLGANIGMLGPTAAPFKATTAAATKVGEIFPMGTKKIGEYATSGALGATLLSGISGLQTSEDPNDTRPFAPEQAAATLKDPMSYALPMASTAVGNYFNRARQYGQAQEVFKEALPRDSRSKGPFRVALNLFYDSLPMLTHMGKRINQLESIGPALSDVVKKIARSSKAMSSTDLTAYVAKNLQLGYNKLKAQENILWNKGDFLSAPIKNSNAISEQVSPIISSLKQYAPAIPKAAESRTILGKLLEKKSFTVGDVKKINTELGDLQQSLNKKDLYDSAQAIKTIRDNLKAEMQTSLSGKQLENYIKASQHSEGIFKLKDEFPNLVKAATNESQATKIVDTLMKDHYKFQKASAGGLISDKGQSAAKARFIAEALEKADQPNGINLPMFLQRVYPKQGTSKAQQYLGDEFKHYEGLMKHLESVQQAKAIGASGRYSALGAMVGSAALGAGAAEMSGNSDWTKTAAVVAYPAMLFAANHPVLKRLLGHMTKNLSKSGYEALNKKVQEIFTKGGYLYTDDGISKKGE